MSLGAAEGFNDPWKGGPGVVCGDLESLFLIPIMGFSVTGVKTGTGVFYSTTQCVGCV